MLRIRTFHQLTKPVFRSSYVRHFSNISHNHNQSVSDAQILASGKTGLQDFLGKTYMYSGAGVLTTLSVATILSHNAAVANSGAMFFTGLGVTVGGLVAMHFGKYHKDTTKNTTVNDPLRLLGYASLVTGMGITSAPAFALMDLSVVLPPALLMTNFVFCGAIIYAKRAPAGSLLKFGPALAGGLLGLVGTSLVALGSDMVFGPNMFSILVHNLDLYAGIPLFTGFVAYDTHVAMERYRLGDPDHLGTSVQLYLDFMNILVRMMQIMSRRKD